MRIAVLHPALVEPGGAEILAVEQLRFLSQSGHEARLFCFAHEPDRWHDRLGSIEVRPMPLRIADRLHLGRQWPRLKRRIETIRDELADAEVVLPYNHPCASLVAALDLPGRRIWHCCEPPRRIHCTTANPALTQYVASAPDRSASCLVTFARHLESSRSARHQAERRRDLAAVASMDRIVAISEFSSRLVKDTYGRDADAVVHPMVRFPRAPRRSSGLQRNGLRVLVHTRLHWCKNTDTVIRGFALYLAKDPNATLDVVGVGPEASALKDLAARLGLQKSARFHGYLAEAELERVYAHCDVLAFLPMDEPFGMVFPEAAARGLMLIGPDHGGPLEILDGGKLGEVIHPLAPAVLCEALERVAAMGTAEVDRRRIQADRACRDRYDRMRVGKQLEAVLA